MIVASTAALHSDQYNIMERFEQWQICEIIIPRNRPTISCLTCTDAVRDFTEYLYHSGDRSYDSPETTILSISELRHH